MWWGLQVFAGVRKQEDVSALKALNNPSIKPVILDVTSKSSIDKAFDTVVAECKASNKVRETHFFPSNTSYAHGCRGCALGVCPC